jgi:ribosomal protein S15P/S13E
MPDAIDSFRQSEALARVYVSHALTVAHSHWLGYRLIAKNEQKAWKYFQHLVLKIEIAEAMPVAEEPDEEQGLHSSYFTLIEELELLKIKKELLEFYAKIYCELEDYFRKRRTQDKEFFEHCIARLNTDNARRCFDRFLTFSGLAEHMVTLAALVIDSVIDVSTWYSGLDAAHKLRIMDAVKAMRMVSAVFSLVIALAILADVMLCLRDTTLSLYQEQEPLTWSLILNTFFNMLIAENRHYRLIKHTVLLITSILGLIFPHLAAPLAVVFYVTVLTIFLIKSYKEVQTISQKEKFVEQELEATTYEIESLRQKLNDNPNDTHSLCALEQALHTRERLKEQLTQLSQAKEKAENTRDVMIGLILLMAVGGALAVSLPLIGTSLLLTVTLVIILYQARQKQTTKEEEFIPIKAKAPRGLGFFDSPQSSDSDIPSQSSDSNLSFQPRLRLSLTQ